MRWGVGLLGLVAIGVCGGAAAWWFGGDPPTVWRTAAVERTDVTARATATGVLQAVSTVEVGTQISGIVAELLADYNQPVEAGQVLARIDTALLQADVDAAAARAEVSRARAAQAERVLTRVTGLHGRGAATAEELDLARADHAVAVAQRRETDVALRRAARNLDYATIRAPIAGTVVRRDVEAGQTVNAGMSAPRLFVIAGDLARMRILASVDEADIGRVREGQPVEFTVSAWPDRTFTGQVDQVRLQSNTVENVVTYTVVIGVDNADRTLLPGMTATVEFLVDTAPDALCVANPALRFRPEPEQIAEAARATWAERRKGGGPGGPGGGRGPKRPESSGTLWTAGPDGLTPLRVQLGLVGEGCTQVEGEGVAEGLEVVVGVELPGAASAGGGSPFSSGQKPRMGGF